MALLFKNLKNMHVRRFVLFCLLTIGQVKSMEHVKHKQQPVLYVSLRGTQENHGIGYMLKVPYDDSTGLVFVSDLQREANRTLLGQGNIVLAGKILLGDSCIEAKELRSITNLVHVPFPVVYVSLQEGQGQGCLLKVPYDRSTGLVAIGRLQEVAESTIGAKGTIVLAGKKLLGESISAKELREITGLFYVRDKPTC